MADVELEYVEEAGPGIAELGDRRGEPADDRAQVDGRALELRAQFPGWEEDQIKVMVQGAGAGLHMAVGRTERDWLMTKKDLERIVPPLTRICNRYEPTLRLSPLADPILFTHGMVIYTWRSGLEAIRAGREAEDEERAADEPDTEAGWERTDVDVDVDAHEGENGRVILEEDPGPAPRYFE